jgi:hypothetical protein
VKDKDRLVGWDDEKVYLYLDGREYCISDEPELVERIIALCRHYYEQKARQNKAEDDAQSESVQGDARCGLR